MGRDEGLRRAREPRKEVSPPPLKPAKTLHHAPSTGVPAAHRPTVPPPLPLARELRCCNHYSGSPQVRSAGPSLHALRCKSLNGDDLSSH